MVYCLAGDRNPRLLALLIDRIVGDETVSRLEIAERNRIGVMVRARPILDARAAGAAEEEAGRVAAVAGVLPQLRILFAFHADLLRRVAHLRGKVPAPPRPALAPMHH